MTTTMDPPRRRELGDIAAKAAAVPGELYRAYQSRGRPPSPAGERILLEFERTYPNAFFVQVGSNDGEQCDPLRAAILRQPWHGIMIEPVPYVFARLQQNYGRFSDRITLEPVAIGDSDGELPFYHLAPVPDHEAVGLPQWYDGIGSFRREHVLKHVEHIPDIADRIVRTDLPTLTFESLCARHGVGRIDLVHIDAEGSDFDVVKAIDYAAHRPRLVIYEHYHLSADDQGRCREFLHAHGYETWEYGMDTWCLLRTHLGPDDRKFVDLWDAVRREERVGASNSLRRALVERPALQRTARKAWRRLKRLAEGDQRFAVELWLEAALPQLTPIEWKMLSQNFDDTRALPTGASEALAVDHPRLAELRGAYAATGLPVIVPSVWNQERIDAQLDLAHFRGENAYVWHYREWPRVMQLKYFAYSEYVRARDPRGLVEQLGEDGQFGCWTFDFPGRTRVSRDLLDSVNELAFLDRHLHVLDRSHLRVLDIGAGYGRMAHRMSGAAPGLDDYCCVDAIPESTFLCEYYTQFRGCAPPARVVPLHELDGALEPGAFDLAVNIHSFSECTYDSIGWWMDRVAALRIPDLFIVPNDRDEVLSFERDGSRHDARPLIEAAGYELVESEPVISDPAVRDLMKVTDHFLLFHRAV
ncbi:MAG TPA: FkbM family methyltransferase [Acidimicrobiia bacterium]|nr:FkbM family methyltransferase [Acidimicrobiia bacterium]